MSELASQEKPQATPTEAPPVYFDARRELAAHFLSGEGLEIGPLHQPLQLPPQAVARYVDRMQIDDLRREYPELEEWDLTPVDVVDDGEKLATIAEASQDFIVANHFLEHCEDPIGTIETHLGKLKPGGVLFYAVPDKRYTFDHLRQPTPIEHMIADHEQGPERSRSEHYREWARFVTDQASPAVGTAAQARSDEWVEDKARELEEAAYSIHMHVWTQAEFLRLILHCRERFDEGFDIEGSARQMIEFMVVLRKRGAFPELPAPDPPERLDPEEIAARNRWSARARRAVSAARRELRATEGQP